MKKINNLILAILGITLLTVPLIVSGGTASDVNIPALGPGGIKTTPEIVTSFSQIQLTIINIIRWFYTLFFIVAVFFFLVAAFNYVRGGTNVEYITTAKNQLKYGIIAIIVALVASGISLVLQNFIWSRGSF